MRNATSTLSLVQSNSALLRKWLLSCPQTHCSRHVRSVLVLTRPALSVAVSHIVQSEAASFYEGFVA